MRKIIRIIAIVLIVAAVAVYLTPHVAQRLYAGHVDQVVAEFHAETAKIAARYPETEPDGGSAQYLSDLYAAMRAYNEDIYENHQADLKDPFSYEAPSFDLTQWGFQENIVGYIDIPRMGITLPIYLGATADNMHKGAAHLSETSLPIGGVNTNCVIAAHRGSWAGAMFRDIQKLQIGDEISVTNLWTSLTYRVAEIKIINPDDIRQVCIQDGRDLVTLITCHPYGKNSQRYVVYCERVTDAG